MLATITFTTKKDIAAGETFSIGIDPASIVASGLSAELLAIVKAGVPGAIMFNTETVDPTPPDPTPPEPPPVDPMPPVESPLLISIHRLKACTETQCADLHGQKAG